MEANPCLTLGAREDILDIFRGQSALGALLCDGCNWASRLGAEVDVPHSTIRTRHRGPDDARTHPLCLRGRRAREDDVRHAQSGAARSTQRMPDDRFRLRLGK